MLDFFRKWIRILLGFSARETNGFLILLPLVLAIVFSEPIYRFFISHRKEDFSNEQKFLDSLMASWTINVADTARVITNEESNQQSLVYATFNPNSASAEELERAGFKKFLAKRIVSYRQKGGQFRFRSDLLKIYGIDSAFYKTIRSRILLPEKVSVAEIAGQRKASVQSQKGQFIPFDLNTADTSQLKSVYGVGTKLAGRIIKFREALGGFVKMAQLHEIYGLDSAVCEKLKKASVINEQFVPKKIDLNTADEKELSAHPYLTRSFAKALVAWRFQHGKFSRVEQIRDLHLIKDNEAEKILPYLKVDD